MWGREKIEEAKNKGNEMEEIYNGKGQTNRREKVLLTNEDIFQEMVMVLSTYVFHYLLH